MLYAMRSTFYGRTCRIITEKRNKLYDMASSMDDNSLEIKLCQTEQEAYDFAYQFTDSERRRIYDGRQFDFLAVSGIHMDAEDIMRAAIYFHVPIDDNLKIALSRFLDDTPGPDSFPADELYEIDKDAVKNLTGADALSHALEWETRRLFILDTAEIVRKLAGETDPFDKYGHALINLAQQTLLENLN